MNVFEACSSRDFVSSTNNYWGWRLTQNSEGHNSKTWAGSPSKGTTPALVFKRRCAVGGALTPFPVRFVFKHLPSCLVSRIGSSKHLPHLLHCVMSFIP